MNSAHIESILTVVGLMSAVIFILAFKFARRETVHGDEAQLEPKLPRAALTTSANPGSRRWRQGQHKQAVSEAVQTAQAAIIAVGVTSAFIMFLCTAGIVASMLFVSF